MRHASETPLAVLTLVFTGVHFALETYYHLQWGQPLQALLVDYIWNGLAVLGGVCSLRVRPRSAAGLLAASWAYALGFGWRSAFGRLEMSAAERAAGNGEPCYVVYLVVIGLGTAAVLLIWSLWLSMRQTLQD